MKTTHERSGRISDHFRGLGTVTRKMVEDRAREIAIINGRSPSAMTENDWRQAKHEFGGVQETEEFESEEPGIALTRWDENPETSGHHVKNELATDEQTLTERLVEEGVEEANHDQMLEGSRPENQRE